MTAASPAQDREQITAGRGKSTEGCTRSFRMALWQDFLTKENFQCSICLELFTCPVSTPCGHSFCMVCIRRYWDNSRACRCPLCKETFEDRPQLHISCTLSEITEQFKALSGFGSSHREASGKPLLEQGTLPSDPDMNPIPLLPVQESASPPDPSLGLALRRFIRRESANSLKVSPYLMHQRHCALQCRNDQPCLSEKCVKTDHQSHAETPEEKRIQKMMTDRIQKVVEIRASLEDIKASMEWETQGIISDFVALESSIKRIQCELLEVMNVNHRSVARQAERLILELEGEIEELKEWNTSLPHDPQSGNSVFILESKDWSSVILTADLCTAAIHSAVSQLVGSFQEELRRLPEKSVQIPKDPYLIRTQPKAKKIQGYAVDVTLDSSTAHPRLILSEDRKQVKCRNRFQTLPDNPERFNRVICVLGQEGFTSGRHYWEVEVGGKTDWDLGVASDPINRKGKVPVNPSSGYWFLSLRDKNKHTTRNKENPSFGRTLNPKKIGIYVDYEKGQVSFYNVDAKLHVYTFQDSFSEIIYPFFSPCTNSSGKNKAPLIITPVTSMT